MTTEFVVGRSLNHVVVTGLNDEWASLRAFTADNGHIESWVQTK